MDRYESESGSKTIVNHEHFYFHFYKNISKYQFEKEHIMCKLSKEDFCKAIWELRRVNDCQMARNDFFHSFEEIDGFVFYPDCSTQLVKMLGILLDDKDDNISYFCFDLDFGRKYKPGMVTDAEGNDIDFSTPEKLYDYLVQEAG